MPAGQFEARCLKVMDDVQSTREPVVITKNGRPVAKLVPSDTPPKEIFLTGLWAPQRGRRD
jgi:prevent-host-death family protein